MADGFLGRWSQRKSAARQGIAPEEQTEPAIAQRPPLAGRVPPPVGSSGAVAAASPVELESATKPIPAPPLPTLQDVADLTADSDFSPFVARAVAPQVRNAAMKKLFADPHFNVMDGLDTYIEDYSVPDPLPLAMLRKMASAKFMKLVDDPTDTPDTDSNDSDALANAVPADVADVAAAEAPSAAPSDADPEPPFA